MIQSPFTPFIILFCHIIETSEASDLEHMKRLVETFESTSNSRTYNTCGKQYRLFKALHDVAAKFLEVKSRVDDDDGQAGMWWMHDANAFTRKTSNILGPSTLESGGTMSVGDLEATNTVDISSHVPLSHEANQSGMEFVDDTLMRGASTGFTDGDLDMELSGAQLWDWFNRNQSLMKVLEDI